MANTKISALTNASALAGTEELPVVQGGETRAATINQINTALSSTYAAKAEAWQTPTLLNSWVNFGAAGYADARYRRNGANVELDGMIKSGSSATYCFQLPAGYRPSASCMVSVGAGGGVGLLTIESSGNITVTQIGSYNVSTYTSLAGVVIPLA